MSVCTLRPRVALSKCAAHPTTTVAKRLAAGAFTCTALAILAGCGGGGAASEPAAPALEPVVLTAQLRIPAIRGVQYRSCTASGECLSGETSAAGNYERIRDRPVDFRVGDVVLFSADALTRPTKTADFSATGDELDPVFLNKMALLYALDADGNPDNGIALSAHAHAAATLPPGTELDFTLAPEAFRQSPVLALVVTSATLADQGLALPPLDPARVQTTLRQVFFAGYYAGKWTLQFDNATSAAYTVHADATVDAPDKPAAFSVPQSSASEVLFQRVDPTGRTLNGRLRADGTGFGTWLDAGGGSGRWTATRQN